MAQAGRARRTGEGGATPRRRRVLPPLVPHGRRARRGPWPPPACDAPGPGQRGGGHHRGGAGGHLRGRDDVPLGGAGPHLDRIEAYEDRINAITVVNPAALERADELDAALARRRGARSPLFCVPVSREGQLRHARPWSRRRARPGWAGSLPARRRLHGAPHPRGGVPSCWPRPTWPSGPSARAQSVSSSFDTTRNAYALDRVPAGSSGGNRLRGRGQLRPDRARERYRQLHPRAPPSRLALVGIRVDHRAHQPGDGVVTAGLRPRHRRSPWGAPWRTWPRLFNVVAGHDPADPYTRSRARARGGTTTPSFPRPRWPARRAHRRSARTRGHRGTPTFRGCGPSSRTRLGSWRALGAEIVDPLRLRRGGRSWRREGDVVPPIPVRHVRLPAVAGEDAAPVHGRAGRARDRRVRG